MLTRLFCDVDDFCHDFIPEWKTQQLETGVKKRRRKRSVSHSEIITTIISYHCSGYRTFKWFYQKQIQKHWNHYFPTLPSYHRFIELMLDILIPLTAFMQSRCSQGKGIAFVDSTPLRVCHNRRIPRHKTFEEIAGRGKSSMGWLQTPFSGG